MKVESLFSELQRKLEESFDGKDSKSRKEIVEDLKKLQTHVQEKERYLKDIRSEIKSMRSVLSSFCGRAEVSSSPPPKLNFCPVPTRTSNEPPDIWKTAEVFQNKSKSTKFSDLSTVEKKKMLCTAFIEIARKRKEQKLKEGKQSYKGEAPFVPCGDHVPMAVCKAAELTKTDCFIDLGCGNGKVVLEAGNYCRAVGVEIDQKVATDALASVKSSGRSNIEIIQSDFKHPTVQKILQEEVTVVFMYLLPRFLPTVTNMLNSILRPGTRVLSYCFGLRQHEVRVNGFSNCELNCVFERLIKPNFESVMFDGALSFVNPKGHLLRFVYAKSVHEGFLLPKIEDPEADKGRSQMESFTGWLFVESSNHLIPQKILAWCAQKEFRFAQVKPDRTGWLELVGNQLSPCGAVVENVELLYKPEKVVEVFQQKPDSEGKIQVTPLLTYIIPLKDESLGWEQEYAVRWKTIDRNENDKESPEVQN